MLQHLTYGRRLELLNGVSHGICLEQPMLRAHDQFSSSAILIVDNILQGQHPEALPCHVSGDKADWGMDWAASSILSL